ncbi:hypothetical protein ACLIYP_28095, partial [Streptomyces nanhaiensis]|uniref:hypothetical protein n=1 Tax=Streptomyces nanhaiensis TaxID=679319 RepID=UPI00399D458D
MTTPVTTFATALERGARRTRRAAARLARPDGHGRGAQVAVGTALGEVADQEGCASSAAQVPD